MMDKHDGAIMIDVNSATNTNSPTTTPPEGGMTVDMTVKLVEDP